MIIKIDPQTRINMTEQYFALMAPATREGKPAWEETKWFSSLETCIQYIAKQKVAEKKDITTLKEFLLTYREILEEVRNIDLKSLR